MNTEENISVEGLKSIGNRIFPEGTLLFAMYGSIGKVAITGRELATNQAILGIRPKNKNQIHLPYLKVWFERNKQFLISQGRGVALQNLSATIIRNLEVPFPSLKDQVYIAYFLSSAEKLITQRKESIRLLDEYLKNTFLEMFGDPVRNEKGWETKKVEEVSDVLTGYAFKSEEYTINKKEINICGGLIIFSGWIDWSKSNYWPLQKTEGLERYWLLEGDIIMAMDRPWISTGFKLAMIKKTDPLSLLVQRTARIRSQKVNNHYLYFLFCHKGFEIHCKPTETTIPHISPTEIKNYIIPIPPVKLQNQFANIVEKTETLKVQYQSSLQELENLYNSLSQQAFKGELNAKDEELLMAAESRAEYKTK
jgi:type I restriction enzyme S subunit